MVTSEREMVRKPELTDVQPERYTSLQPTYEDTVAPDPEEDWEYED
jgi:hypothetical protein